jgi:8-hydroxy-5-deazaflavin:NADPH oxidoreductase
VLNIAGLKVSIIGGGKIGSALAVAWKKADNEVNVGLRGEGREVEVPGVKTTGIRDALTAGDVIALAIPGDAVPGFCHEYSDLLKDKVVIDATNTLSGGPWNQYASLSAAGARYVRAFSTYGFEVLVNPKIAGQTPDQFYTAPDEPVREMVATLIQATGFRPVYIGPSNENNAATVDGIAHLWFALALKQDLGRHLAFRMLSEPETR